MARNPLIVFIALAYALSWSVMLPTVLLSWPPPMIIAATFGPTVAAFLCQRLMPDEQRSPSPLPLLRGIACAVPGMAVVLLAWLVFPALWTADHRQLNWGALLSLNVYNYSTLLGGPLGEEPGWRGYALPRLEARFGATKGTLVMGLVWAGWHLPLFLRPGWESAPFWIYTLMLAGLTVIMSYFVNLARFSLVTAIAIHAMFNTVSRLLGGLFSRTQPGGTLPFELVMAVSGIGVATVLILATRGRLAYQPEARR